jgi:hypothetical protein
MAVARAAHSATSHFVLATARLNFGGRQTVELCTAGGVSSVVIAALSSSAGAARLITRPLPLRLLNTHDEGAGRIRVIIWHPPPGGPTAVADGEDRNDLHALRRRPSPLQRGRSGGQCFSSPQRYRRYYPGSRWRPHPSRHGWRGSVYRRDGRCRKPTPAVRPFGPPARSR